MISNEQLEVWEQHAEKQKSGAYNPLLDYYSADCLLQAIAEIRRLREEHGNLSHNCIVMLEGRRSAETDLAAHQAVVRELADTLEAAQASLCASSDYQKVPSNRYALERIRAALAHPLVQQVREEKI